MVRYNLFHRIHKGLRAVLYDTSMLLQRTDFTMEEEAEEAIIRLHFVIALFEKYQCSEDVYILPAMTAYEPGIADSFEQDHEKAFQLGKKLETLVIHFKELSLPLEKISKSGEIMAQFDELMLFSIVHMAREEQFINKMLWRFYSDKELQKIAWKMVLDMEETLLLPYSRWMLRGLNNNEIVRWIKEIKCIAGEEDFRSLLQVAETELKPQRWDLLQDVLDTRALMAGTIYN